MMDAYTAFLLRNGYQADAERYNEDYTLPATNGQDSAQIPLGDYCAVLITGVAGGSGGPPTTYSYSITDLNGLYGAYTATVNPQLRNPVKRYGPFTAGNAVVWNVITGYIETAELDTTSTTFAVTLTQTGGSAGSSSAYCSYTYSAYNLFGNLLGTNLAPVCSPARIVMQTCVAANAGLLCYNASNQPVLMLANELGSSTVCS